LQFPKKRKHFLGLEPRTGVRWAEHVAHMGKRRNMYRVWWESPKEKDHLKDQGVDGRVGSKWTLG
jgi:hypothetical protein